MTATLNDILESHRTRRPIVVGILNVTPDSFSDGGQFLSPDDAAARAREMVDAGAEAIDVGAESTRPGSERVGPDEQIARLRDALPAAAETGVPVSIDTTSARVAAFALDAGASIINDVTAGRQDPEMLPLTAETGAPIVLMHMLGEPKTMQTDPTYGDVVEEVREFFLARIADAVDAGVDERNCILDPGIGFGKRMEHNLALLAATERLCELGRPVLVGVSRKRFLGELIGQTDPSGRVTATVAACLETWRRGATLFRVHDVRPLVEAISVVRAIGAGGRENSAG